MHLNISLLNHLGNVKGFRSSVPGIRTKTKDVFLIINHNIRKPISTLCDAMGFISASVPVGGDPEGFCPWETPLPCCPGPSRHTASSAEAPLCPWLPWVSTVPGAPPLLTVPPLPSHSHCHGPRCILHVPGLASGPSLGPTPPNPTTALHKTPSSPCRIPTSHPLDPLCSSHWPPLCWSLLEALGSQCLSVLRSFHAEEAPSSEDSSEKWQGRAGPWGPGGEASGQVWGWAKEAAQRREQTSVWDLCSPLPPTWRPSAVVFRAPPTSSLCPIPHFTGSVPHPPPSFVSTCFFILWHQKGSRICHFKIWHFGLFWAADIWRTANAGGFLWIPHLSKDKSSFRWIVTDSPPQEFHQPEIYFSSERRLEVHVVSDKLCHKLSYLPSLLLRAALSSLKVIYSPLRGLYKPSPFPIKMVFRDFPGDPVAKTLNHSAGGPGLIPAQKTKAYMPQPRWKFQHAKMKAWHSQIHKLIF